MPSRFATRVVVPKSQRTEEQKQGSSCKVIIVKDPGRREIWSLGSKYVLEDVEYRTGSEVQVANVKLAKQHTSIPIPGVLASWREGNRFFTIEEQIDGECLEYILDQVSPEDIARISWQVGQYVTQLRSVTSSRMEMLDGRAVVDFRLFKPLTGPLAGVGYSPCTSDADVRRQLSLAIRNHLDGATLDIFMTRMPSARPFTFSHADIHGGNVMVKDGNFVALIDWELAGFYPVWWDFVNGDAALCDQFPPQVQYMEALDWFTVYHAVRERPGQPDTVKMLKHYLGQ